MKVAILNFGGQTDYLYGLVTGLSKDPDISIEVVDSDNCRDIFNNFNNVRLINIRKNANPQRGRLRKITDLMLFYARLFLFAFQTESKIFHIQWQTTVYLLDRLIFIPLYKILGKKVIYTAHNVDNWGREGERRIFNETTLNFFYNRFDSIIVHTQKVKNEITARFRIAENKVHVIPHGINNRVINTDLSPVNARKKLGISETEKVVLFFGAIEPYKGLESLLDGYEILSRKTQDVSILIAGSCFNKRYRPIIFKKLAKYKNDKNIRGFIEYIKDEDIETYFKSADCLVLPYTNIYQSGVIFLAYSFGLPIIATDVGSFREDILDGKTGFICEKENSSDLVEKIILFFNSSLFKEKEKTRRCIQEYAIERYSWEKIGALTCDVYKRQTK